MFLSKPCFTTNTSITESDELISQNHAHEISVVDFAAACVDSLEQLVDFIIGHLFAQVGKNWVNVSR